MEGVSGAAQGMGTVSSCALAPLPFDGPALTSPLTRSLPLRSPALSTTSAPATQGEGVAPPVPVPAPVPVEGETRPAARWPCAGRVLDELAKTSTTAEAMGG
jgi:hypothetical protein